jgi:aspartate aminotransferase
MSGWRVGFAVTSTRIAQLLGGLINTSLSCVPPFTQLAATAAMRNDLAESDALMRQFEHKVRLLVEGLNRVPGFKCLMPAGTFYAFPNVRDVCTQLGITSHGLALYLLTAADDKFGVACLGGECFGEAGRGYLRFSCAESDEAIEEAVDFLPTAIARADRVAAFLAQHPEHSLAQ